LEVAEFTVLHIEVCAKPSTKFVCLNYKPLNSYEHFVDYE